MYSLQEYGGATIVHVLLTRAQKNGFRKASEIWTTVGMRLQTIHPQSGHNDGARSAMLQNLREHIIANVVDGTPPILPLRSVLIIADRCIPKMDHHCPWTTNCVSHITFPHFLRFILYAVISMSILAYHLFIRASVLFSNRNLPAYLGPPTWAMAHLFVLILVNGVTLFALSILFVRATYSLAINTTMIESWEIERHEALVERARKTGGWVYGNGGQRLRVEHQEFPYDIGIWKNLVQGMGTANVLAWFLPFGGGPSIDAAAEFEVNGFEDESKTWPPPDPDKLPRVKRNVDVDGDFEDVGDVDTFRRRQQDDYERRRMQGEGPVKFGKLQPLTDEDDPFGPSSSDPVKRDSSSFDVEQDEYESEVEEGIDGEEGWTNAEGDRLRDFGVDEDAELLAEEEIPLGELLRRRKARTFT